jgi:predicted Rossmann-fold nucleotide-binding protein
LNTNDFYTPLLEWINKAVESGFIRPANAGLIVEAKTVDEVVEKLESYQLSTGRYHLDWSVQSPLEGPQVPFAEADIART